MLSSLKNIFSVTTIVDYSFILFMLSIFFISNNFLIYKNFENVNPKIIVSGVNNSARNDVLSFIEMVFIHIFNKFDRYKIRFNILKTKKEKELLKFRYISLVFLFYLLNFLYSDILLKRITESFSIKDLFGIFVWIIALLFLFLYYRKLKKLEIQFKKRYKVVAFIISCIIVIYNFFIVDSSIINFIAYFHLLISLLIIVYPLSLYVVILVKNPVSFFKQEYDVAKKRKLQLENRKVVEEFISEYQHHYPDSILNRENIINRVDKVDTMLRIKINLAEFLIKNFKEQFNEEKIMPILNKLILPIEIMKSDRAKYIFERNKDNLYTSLINLLIYIISLVVIKQYFSIITLVNFNHIVFSFIFVRLLLRSIEISIAFFKDVQDGFDSKRSSLSKNERSKLALKSLLEIMIYALILSLILKSNQLDLFNKISIRESLNDILKILNVTFYVIAVSLFNASFETFKDIFENKGKVFILIRSVHIIQITTSLILLTICLSSYLNQNNNLRKIKVYTHENNLYLVEYSNNEKRVIICINNFISVNDLIIELNNMFSSNLIGQEDHEEYIRVVNNYQLK